MSYVPDWSEVRADFFETGNDFMQNEGNKLAQVSIDAWKSPDENEQGTVIARVMLSTHGDILVDYIDGVARLDSMAQEAISDAKKQLKEYFQELSQTQEKAPEINLPDGSKVSVQYSEGMVNADEKDKRTWASLDLLHVDSEGKEERLCAVDYEDGKGARSLVYASEQDDPIHTHTHIPPEKLLNTFYYTFGTSESFPYQKGYVEVHAPNRKEADRTFRLNYPDRFPGILNCANVYDKDAFDGFVKLSYVYNPGWDICHDRIYPPEFAQEIQPNFENRLADAKNRSGTPESETKPFGLKR